MPVDGLVDSHQPEGSGRSGLYVRADQVKLWRLWATGRCPCPEVRVSGAQRFSPSGSRNSADIARATHSMADLALPGVEHLVMLSDHGGFISLHVAIRDEHGIPQPGGRVPFLWSDNRRTPQGCRRTCGFAGSPLDVPGGAAPALPVEFGPLRPAVLAEQVGMDMSPWFWGVGIMGHGAGPAPLQAGRAHPLAAVDAQAGSRVSGRRRGH